jgi:hypothetical protein
VDESTESLSRAERRKLKLEKRRADAKMRMFVMRNT